MQPKPDFVAVVSIERTATQSVYKSLVEARAAPIVRHVHYLDTAEMRGPLPINPEKRKTKELQEEQVRRFIGAQSLRRAVFTVLRDPLDRVQSCVWYDREAMFGALFDKDTGLFDAEADDWIDYYVQRFATWGREYGEKVFKALEMPADLTPGHYITPNGTQLYALDFAHLARDFSQAALDLLGEATPLAKINTGASLGDPLVYQAFRRRFDELWPGERFEGCSVSGDYRRPAQPNNKAPESPATIVERKIEHFDGVWGKVAVTVDALKAENERSMSRVLRLSEAKWRQMDLVEVEGAINGARLTMPRAALIGARQQLQMRTLIAQARVKTTMVVELASGWGLNLIDLYLSGGPRGALYRGMELSTAGRECAEKIAALDEGFSSQFRCMPFNFYDPDYSMLEHKHKHVLAFSSHGIEQIPELPREAITGLFKLGERITGVHFEPVGWQIRNEADLPPADVGATQENSERAGYNGNLLPLLRQLEEEGALTIKALVPDIFGHKAKNVSSLVVWESVPKA